MNLMKGYLFCCLVILAEIFPFRELMGDKRLNMCVLIPKCLTVILVAPENERPTFSSSSKTTNVMEC